MMIARATASDGGEILILGLSRENLRRLEAQPIRVRRETHGDGVPDGWEILIIFGETELAMKRQFEEHGLITPETKTYVDPRL